MTELYCLSQAVRLCCNEDAASYMFMMNILTYLQQAQNSTYLLLWKILTKPPLNSDRCLFDFGLKWEDEVVFVSDFV